ncbi:MAG: VCBS domain-containing protein [Cyanobacteria bacterium J06649_12]
MEDGRGGSDTATVTVTIKGIGIQALNDENSILESEPNPEPKNPTTVSGNVLSNDESLRGTPQVISVNEQPVPESGDLIISIPGSSDSLGTLTIDRNGEYTFALNDDNPDVDALNEGDFIKVPSISYTVNNGFEKDTASAALDITINGVDPIVDAIDDEDTVKEDEKLIATGNLLKNDEVSPENTPIFVESVEYDGQTFTLDAPPTSINDEDGSKLGDLTVKTDGTYEFVLNNDNPKVQTLDEGDEIPLAPIKYILSTGTPTLDDANLQITILGTDDEPDPPIIVVNANDDLAIIKEEGINTPPKNLLGNLLTNDIVLPEGLPKFVESISYRGQPIFFNTPTAINDAVDGSKLGDLIVQTDGAYAFVLNNANPKIDGLNEGDEIPLDDITYILSNGTETNDANLEITILGTNDAPVAQTDVIPGVYREGNPISFNVSRLLSGEFSNGIPDSDVETDLSGLSIVSVDTRSAAGGLVIFDGTEISYIHSPNFITHELSGARNAQPLDTFTYRLSDGTGGITEGTVVLPGVQDSEFLQPEQEFNNCFSREDCERLINANVIGFNRDRVPNTAGATKVERNAQFQSVNMFGVLADQNVEGAVEGNIVLRTQITGRLGREDGTEPERPEVDIFEFTFKESENVTFDVDFATIDTKLFLFDKEEVDAKTSSRDPVTGLELEALITPQNLQSANNAPNIDNGTSIDPNAGIVVDPFFTWTVPGRDPSERESPDDLTRSYYLGVAAAGTRWNADGGYFELNQNRDVRGDYTLQVSISNPIAIPIPEI